MPVQRLLWFKDIHKEDVGIVGGKGANLGEMINAHFQIPNGFVVTAQAYFEFLEENNLKEKILEKASSIDVESTFQLEQASAEIKEMIMEAFLPEELKNEILIAYNKLGEKQLAWMTSKEEAIVAVRSSATAEDLPNASFAGQQETYLNVKGKENLLTAVQKCFASLFTPRAIYYRAKQGFGTEKIGLAVVIQKMVESNASGIIFTANPVNENRNEIIIDAIFGLGEPIVSGAITPDTYTIDKKKMEIKNKTINTQEWKLTRGTSENKQIELEKSIGEKQKLSEKQILELAEIAKKIELHYNSPQDIEFAIENEKLFIVQSRPITTLKEEKQAMRKEKIKGKVLLKGISASPGIAFGKVKVIESIENINELKKGEILVTKMTSPDWVPAMQKSIAIITNEGGKTCHAAIVSRELGIPCIVGTKNATQVLRDKQEVTVDGCNGIVFEGKTKKTKAIEEKTEEIEEKTEEIEEKNEEEKAGLMELLREVKEFETETEKTEKGKIVEAPIVSIVEKKISEEELKKHLRELLKVNLCKVKVNIALSEAAEKASQTNPDGIGLLRAEHLLTQTGIHPMEFIRQNKQRELIELIKKELKKIIIFFRNKPIWYRTFDARTDEFRNLKGGEKEPVEQNPMLGWHGIRRSLDDKELLKAEFIAIRELSKEGYNNLGIMLPFVQSDEEIRMAKEIAEEVGLELGKQCKFGVMIETPASVWIIDDIIKEGIQFVSFGTNDLTQLTLGIDRNNERIQKWFNEMHLGVLRQLKHVIDRCNEKGIETSICGQAGSNPEMVEILVRLGIKSVSANIDAVEQIRETVSRTEKEIIIEGIKKLLEK